MADFRAYYAWSRGPTRRSIERFESVGFIVEEHVVAEKGVLLVAEVVGPGRQARGESLEYDFFHSETEVRRPDGRPLFRDTTRLTPADDLASLGLLGAWRAIGTLYAIAGGIEASVFDSTIAHCEEIGLLAGCSELPNGAGMWFRVMALDAPSAYDAIKAAWAAAAYSPTCRDPPRKPRGVPHNCR